MITFLLFVVLNAVFIIWLIRWRGFFSCEGLGMVFLFLGVFSDAVGLIIICILDLNLVNIESELQLRFLPNIALFIGLVSFFVGLLVSNSNKKSINYDFSEKSEKIRQKIITNGYFLMIMGLGMNIYALYSWGFRSISDYFSGMYMYQATKMGGGFMDSGLNIAILGLSLLVAVYSNSWRKQIFFILVILGLSFVLSTSKSGIANALIILFFTIYVFNKELFKRFFKPLPLIILFVIFLIGLGIKTQIKYGQGKNELFYNKEDILRTTSITIGRRYGPFGLYRGYSFLVNRLIEDPSLFFGTKVLEDSITAWIPRFVWANKPVGPFLARGDLFNENFSIDKYGNEAPTFAGAAFADSGFLSLVLYSLIGGFILGLIRKITVSQSNHPFPFILGYIFFSTQMANAIAESGFINLFYYIVFSAGLFFVIFMILGLRDMLRASVSGTSR